MLGFRGVLTMFKDVLSSWKGTESIMRFPEAEKNVSIVRRHEFALQG